MHALWSGFIQHSRWNLAWDLTWNFEISLWILKSQLKSRPKSGIWSEFSSPPCSHLRQKPLYSETKQNKSDTSYPVPLYNTIWEAENTGVLLQNMNGYFSKEKRLSSCPPGGSEKSCTQKKLHSKSTWSQCWQRFRTKMVHSKPGPIGTLNAMTLEH